MLCVAAAQVRTCLEFLRLLHLMVLHSIRSGQDKLGWDGMGCCDMRIDEVEEEEEVEKKA